MTNMKIKVLSTREIQIMNILWSSDKPLSANQIAEVCDDMSVFSVQQVLQRLLKNEIIKVAEIGYSNTVLTRFYVSVLTQAEYVQFLLGDSNLNLYKITSFFIENNTDKNTLQDLKKQIVERQKKLGE
ncbi:transcriptional regulator, BlaI/MecI/CopY family [[Eubacterium] cylindroides ATCC 27803]|uniref:Transcriptional regulator, BlaI/MecI/CopY family n=2 Tax=Faecalitalea cylindroides TaxID=39483 RepID=U2PSP3_9FIRM|nr:transcriptional regulator, BlaI/MecI/CopY family [[Eubacterium] cylindroides ATCC 27803] [Faecalitalea cylindroides ATCC 27803]